MRKGNRPDKLWFNTKGVKEFLKWEGSRWAEFKGEHKARNVNVVRFWIWRLRAKPPWTYTVSAFINTDCSASFLRTPLPEASLIPHLSIETGALGWTSHSVKKPGRMVALKWTSALWQSQAGRQCWTSSWPTNSLTSLLKPTPWWDKPLPWSCAALAVYEMRRRGCSYN